MSPSIVFIHVGPTIPAFTADAMAQAARFSSGTIYLVGERAALAQFALPRIDRVVAVASEDLGLSPVHAAFRQVSPFDKGFRDGFWTHTTERFFYLATLAERDGLENAIHLESDVMLYADIDELGPKLGALYPGLAVPFDNDDRAVASLLFWRRPEALVAFCQLIVDVLTERPDPSLNDMAFFGEARRRQGREQMGGLPVLPKFYTGPFQALAGFGSQAPQRFSEHADDLGMVFDAAAIGQYLAGPDPKNFIPRQRFWYQPPRLKPVLPAPGPGFINESTIFNPSAFSYSWVRDDKGRQVPRLAVGEAKLPIANLHIHRKDLAKFGSAVVAPPPLPITAPPIAVEEVISGERLQALADVAVITAEKRAFHGSLPEMKLAAFSPDLAPEPAGLAALRGATSIFVYSDLIEPFLSRILPLLETPVVLITHNGDTGVDERHRAALNDPKIIHWFAQNAKLDHPKLTALPIGIANAQWRHGDAPALTRVTAQVIPKRGGLYVNFEVGTNPKVRGPLLAALAEKPFAIMGRERTPMSYLNQGLAALIGKPFVNKGKSKPYEVYLADMAKWRFTISPPGNGIDCHRTWEALYLGVIPVATPAAGGLYEYLPVIITEDLAGVTMEGLEAAFGRLEGPFAWEKLTLSYWRDRIRDAAGPAAG